ncbi:MAG: hypothetical protein HQK85_05265 [Nitrospinae bacterium]|nr:hypothetical protein [Nitrospinota bacterium]
MDFNAPVLFQVGSGGVFSVFPNPPEGDMLRVLRGFYPGGFLRANWDGK